MAIAIGMLACRAQRRVIAAWTAGETSGVPPAAVAVAVHLLPIRLFVVTAGIALVTSLPLGVLTTLIQLHRLSVADLALLLVAGILFSLWGIVLLWMWAELAMRPILDDLAASEVTSALRGRSMPGVTLKLTIALGSALLVGSCYGGALSARTERHLMVWSG